MTTGSGELKFSEGLAFINKGYHRANVTHDVTYPDGIFVSKRIVKT